MGNILLLTKFQPPYMASYLLQLIWRFTTNMTVLQVLGNPAVKTSVFFIMVFPNYFDPDSSFKLFFVFWLFGFGFYCFYLFLRNSYTNHDIFLMEEM